MSKKVLKILEIIGIAFLIIMAIICIFFFINANIIQSSENNLFNNWKKNEKKFNEIENISINNKENVEKEKRIKIEDLPKDYSYIKAIQDKCVVSIHGTKIYNKDEIDKFLEKVNKKEPYFIRCINYTTEGDMIITDVEFNGVDAYLVCYDSTRDNYAGKSEYKKGKYSKLIVNRQNLSTTIFLNDKVEGDLSEKVTVTFYNNDAKVVNDYDVNYLLNIHVSDKKTKEKITTVDMKDKYGYDIYYYGLKSCDIELNNEEIDLKGALLDGKVTMEQIIKQAENDIKNDIIDSDIFENGETKIYHYDTYAIIKNISAENKDVYIAIPDIDLEDIE